MSYTYDPTEEEKEYHRKLDRQIVIKLPEVVVTKEFVEDSAIEVVEWLGDEVKKKFIEKLGERIKEKGWKALTH